MAYPASSQDLLNNVILKARLDATDDAAKTQDWINSVYTDSCLEVDFFEEASTLVTLTANQTNVQVPTGIMEIEYIIPTGSDGTTWGPMLEVPFEDILEVRAWQGGQVSTGAPSRYGYRSGHSPTIEFWPTATGGETLEFYGTAIPTPFSAWNSSEFPIFPEPFSKVIEYGALIQAAEYKKDLLMLQTFQTQYAQWLSKFQEFVNMAAGAKTQQFRIEGERPWPRRNDIDQGY